MANMSGFIGESYKEMGAQSGGGLYSYCLKPLIMLLPEFDQVSPSKFLVPARLLSWPLLAWLGFTTICLKTLPLAIFSLLIFTYREIAKVVV
jgi:hypothetical protein